MNVCFFIIIMVVQHIVGTLIQCIFVSCITMILLMGKTRMHFILQQKIWYFIINHGYRCVIHVETNVVCIRIQWCIYNILCALV